MPHPSDQDGKSSTASSVDGEHYPAAEEHDHKSPDGSAMPTNADIAERAYFLWIERGCPDGSDEENWLEAERELRDACLSRRLTELTHQKAGSVQP